MNALNLPDPIAAYFAADMQSPEALAMCFTAQASVEDEGHTHTGHAAIQAWKAAAAATYSHTTEPFALAQNDGQHTVSVRVAGNFPGSPVTLHHRFRLELGRIARLEIRA
jgi:hypothetical protein